MRVSYIKRFYYETALSPSRYSQVVLRELLDPSHVLFGCDFPFAPSQLVAAECKQLSELEIWSPEEHYGINRGHALRLFPRYKEDSEKVSPLPLFEKVSFRQRLKRLVNRATAALATRAQGH